MLHLKRCLLTMLVVLEFLFGSAQTAVSVSSEVPSTQQGDGMAKLAVKTNLLYDAALIPNLGLEVPLGGRWTVAADGFWAWWSKNSRHRYWQGYGGYLAVRRYFGNTPHHSPLTTHPSPRFTGHHLGIYALGLTYDVEWGGRGYQAARFGFGGGVEYGYSLPIGRRLNLDFSLGIGFQDGEYKVYEPMDGHYVWQSTHKRHWLGPTKAEVSLVWRMK